MRATITGDLGTGQVTYSPLAELAEEGWMRRAQRRRRRGGQDGESLAELTTN